MAAEPPWSVAWVTGASTGIGAETARLLAARGVTVAVSARSREKLEAMAGAAPATRAYPLDVADESATAGTVDAIERDIGPIDLAILSAGTWHPVDPATGFDAALFRDTMEVNFFGVINAMAALVPRMVARGRGHIAIVSSVSGYRGLPRAGAYGASKAALIYLAEAVRPELESRGVMVSVINPGFVRTPMTAPNRFPMPLLMEPDAAARRIVAGLEAGKYEIAFPTRLALLLKLLRILPNAAFFWVVRKFMLKS